MNRRNGAILAIMISAIALPVVASQRGGKPDDWYESPAMAAMLSTIERGANLPRGMAHCLVYAESRFKPSALSPNGEDRGLCQINRRYQSYIVEKHGDVRPAAFRWDDGRQNATAGCNYLAALIHQFGDSVYLGLIAYNWGPGNLARIRSLDEIPLKKRKYAEDILRLLDAWDEGWVEGEAER